MSFTGSLTTIVVGEKANEFLGTLAGHHSKTVLTRVLAEAGRGLVLDDKRKVIRPDSPRFFVDATPSHERALTVRETLEFVFETSWGSKDAKALSSWLSSRAFVEELASSLGLRHVLETRIFFLSTVQSRCASLGEALLTAAAYAAAGESGGILLAQEALDGLPNEVQLSVAAQAKEQQSGTLPSLPSTPRFSSTGISLLSMRAPLQTSFKAAAAWPPHSPPKTPLGAYLRQPSFFFKRATRRALMFFAAPLEGALSLLLSLPLPLPLRKA